MFLRPASAVVVVVAAVAAVVVTVAPLCRTGVRFIAAAAAACARWKSSADTPYEVNHNTHAMGYAFSI